MCCIGRWTVDELKDMTAMVEADFGFGGYGQTYRQSRLRPYNMDTDLYKRVSSAIQDGFIKRFDMRVSSRDGDQECHSQ